MDLKALFDLTGKVAVVTGGSRGIGAAMVTAFAHAGADVVIASRKLENCQELATKIEQETGRRALPVASHVGRWEDCDQLYEKVYAEFGRCDVLVNNAGASPLYPSLDGITEEFYDKIHGLNMKGPFRLGALFGTRMAAEDGGSIINVSTVGSLRPSGKELIYSTAKAGLNALTIGLADEFGPKVRVNCILPGMVATDIADAWTDDTKERAARVPMARMGTADDFVGTALWLASPASAWITGVLVRVDGGLCRQTG